MIEASLAPLTPFPHQQDMLDAVDVTLDDGITRYLIEAATGVGKTFAAAERVAEHIRQDVGNRVLYLCRRRGLLDYAISTFLRQCNGDVSTGVIGDQRRETDRQITAAMFQSMNSGEAEPLYRTFARDEFSLLVVDEAASGLAPTYREVIEYYAPKERLAMTHFAHRHDGLDLNLFYGPTIYRKTLPESMDEGLVAPMSYHLHTDQFRTIDELRELCPDLTPGQLNRSIFIPQRDEEIVRIFGEELEAIANPHGLIFCKSILHAERMAALMAKKLRYSVRPIHGKQPIKLSKDLIEAFKKGDLQLATVVGMFDEGIDIPSINFIGMLNDTQSDGLWKNRIGRGLRLAPGKERVVIADVTNSLPRIGQVDRLHTAIAELSDARPTRPVKTLHCPQVEFRFTKKPADIYKEIEEVRKRLQKSQSGLNLDEAEHPMPIVMPTKLSMKDGSGEKIVPLGQAESVILSYMFDTEYGHISERTLRKACRQYFSWVPQALGRMLDDLAQEGFVSPVVVPMFGVNETIWRLNNQTIDGFLNIETHAEALNDDINQALAAIVQVDRRPDLESKRIIKYYDQGPDGSYYEVRLLRGTMSLSGVDLTETEFSQLQKEIPNLHLNSRLMESLSCKEVHRQYLDHMDCVIVIRDVQNDKNYEIVRRCGPAQVARFMKEFDETYPPVTSD